MTQYNYKAKDKTGQTVSGVVESPSSAVAAHTLQEHGLLVVSISEKRELFNIKNFKPGVSGVSGQDLSTFTRLLSTMLKAGLPLVDALSNLAIQMKSPYFKEVIRALLHDVQSGGTLSGAMSKYPKVFNNLYVSLIRAGEASGKADETMEKLADMLEADQEFKGKVKGALIYPAIIVVAMAGVAIFMITAIIPKIAEVYKDFNAELPLPTQILITLSDLIRNYFILVIIFGALLYLAYRTLRKNPTSDFMINNAMLRFPVLGDLQQDVTLTIINRTLGTLINSGVSILEALKIVAQAVDNNKFRLGLEGCAAAVEKGLPLSNTLRRNSDFPLIMSQLTAIGEETGSLGDSMLRVSKYYQDAAERKTKALTTTLEPLMIILMGGMVGGLAIAVLLPMFNLVNVIH